MSKLEDLKDLGADILQLDVTAPLLELHKIAEQALGIHRRVDVVVNNAGELEMRYLLFGHHMLTIFASGSFLAPGAIEEITFVP
jgi:NAD(P)-dependent dehydrogenase (short-subunit alcohol dehydrogenase family)